MLSEEEIKERVSLVIRGVVEGHIESMRNPTGDITNKYRYNRYNCNVLFQMAYKYGLSQDMQLLLDNDMAEIDFLYNDPGGIRQGTSQGENNSTLLMIACREDDVSQVELLISLGASLDIQNKQGQTALMYASYEGNIKVVKLLLENGADVNLKTIYGWTAEKYAIDSAQCGDRYNASSARRCWSVVDLLKQVNK